MALLRIAPLLLLLAACSPQQDLTQRLQEIFQTTLVEKNQDALASSYDPGFILYANGKTMDYSTFIQSHAHLYEPSVVNTVRFDRDTLLSQGDKAAGRLWLASQTPGTTTTLEVLLIAQFKNNRIFRIWETTHPDWTEPTSPNSQ